MAKSRRATRRASRKQRGGGVQTSQQWFDPAVFPPSAGFMAAPSTAPTSTMIRPMLASTFQTGGTRRHRRSQRAGGYQMSQQWFDPAAYPPSAGLLGSNMSTAPTANAVRPVLLSTFPAGSQMIGGTRRGKKGRKMSGGFSPAVMGAFVENAKAVVVPLGLYLAYHTMVPKKDKRGRTQTRKSSRK
jgi:hypothetical protein